MSSEYYLSPKTVQFSEEELLMLQEASIPKHIAIIMDGNRRWAKMRKTSGISHPFGGHWAGARVLTEIIEAASDMGIKVLTVYGFSTENWSRSSFEVDALMHIFEMYLKNNQQKMIDQGVRFSIIGDLSPVPPSLIEQIKVAQEATKNGETMDLVIGFNYGGRDDMRRASLAIAKDFALQKIRVEDITEKLIDSYLDTARWKDPDLLIRTSGEMRLSNFLLWQLAYTEVYVTNTLWPDFTAHDLLMAVLSYQRRQRRRGR